MCLPDIFRRPSGALVATLVSMGARQVQQHAIGGVVSDRGKPRQELAHAEIY
jgi:hypothetical protein